jgi:hypothetical protein
MEGDVLTMLRERLPTAETTVERLQAAITRTAGARPVREVDAEVHPLIPKFG